MSSNVRHTRLYSVFEKQDGRWVRLSLLAFPKETAVKHFQNALLAYPLGIATNPRELKVVGATLSHRMVFPARFSR